MSSSRNHRDHIARAALERLEERQFLSLVGVMPQFPVVSYDSTGQLAYHADTGELDIHATALTFKQSAAAPPKAITNSVDGFQIHLLVDSAGNLLGGLPGAMADLSISGTIVERTGAVFASGVLLTGRIEKFGFQDTGTASDNFDFQFAVTGGALASLYAGMDLGVVLGSEASTFVGSFAADFTGHAKGNVGEVAPVVPPALPASVSGFVYVDANNNGAMDSGETPIPGATVALSGTNDLGQSVSLTAVTDGDGAYSFANLHPGTYSLTESQPAGYLDGKDTIGTQGGSVANDLFTNVVLVSGQNGLNNNFGELLPASITGNVYYDANNNGLFDSGETGIAGVAVALAGTDDLGQGVNLTTTTDAAGAYNFGNLRPGTYSLAETQPAGYLDGKDAIGSQGGVTSNDLLTGATLAAGQAGVNNNFGELTPASIAGNVYLDTNNNGIFDSGETGIAGVTVTLTGTDDLGQSVSLTTTTNGAGAYSFANLRPGTYSLVETQPASYLDGKDAVGNLGGVVGNDIFTTIPVRSGDTGVQYNFGEQQALTPLASGMTATIGFWNNKNGQALINSLNGGSTSTSLGNWLAATFPKLYGSQAGSGKNLAGKTNAQVAAYFQTLFNVKGQKLDAQVLAGALAVYVTNSSLAGTAAVKYGFKVSSSGTGAAVINVGANGAAFGVVNNTQISVLTALQAANNQAVNGSLYGGNTALRNLANTIFDYINTTGDIV